MQKRWINVKNPNFLLPAALVASGAVLALALALTGGAGAQAEVRVSGEVTARYPLSADRTVRIEGANGGTNLLVIRNGAAHIAEASCPDGLCIHMGTVSRTGQSIVCLPNEVVVEITSGAADADGQEVDVVAK